MDSILTSIKKMLGIEAKYEHFDQDIIMHINSVFMDLAQIGVGPSRGFMIEDDMATWLDFLPEETNFQAVKTYMYLRVKLMFDPPTSSTVVSAMQRDIDKWEWRFSISDSVSDTASAGGQGTLNYEELYNLPKINGKTLIGNFNEQDPTVKTITKTEIDDLWNDE